MLYDCEGSGSPDAGLHHSRAIPGVKARGYRLFHGQVSSGHKAPANDPELTVAQANAIITGAQTSQNAMLAAMPAWAVSWFNGLGSAEQSDVYEEIKAHPAVT